MKTIDTVKGLVSCIVPAYNTEKYIYDCLMSVKNQSYNDIELIIVEDGSTDGTMNEINRFCSENGYRFQNIHIKQHDDNKGLCSAINSALELVNGEYTMWFDSDDLLAEDNIMKKVEYLKQHPDVKCVMAEADTFDENGILNVKLGNRPIIGNWFDSFLLGYSDMSAGLNLVYTNILLHSLPDTGLRTDIKEQNWYIMPILASFVKIGHLSEVLYHYRVRADSDSHRHPIKTGSEYKEFWDSVDRQRFYTINDCKLSYVYKCRAYALQAKNSIVDRITTIDEKMLEMDSSYVNFIVKCFLNDGNVITSAGKRAIYLWGSSVYQRRLKNILRDYIDIKGFINSSEEKQEADVICGTQINLNRMYIIITLQYHKEIIDLLKEACFVNHRDYYYPKADLYNDVETHTYENII